MTFYVSCLLNTLSSCLKKKKQNTGIRVKVKAKANQMHTVFLTHTKNTHINLEILCAQQEVNFNGIKPQ